MAEIYDYESSTNPGDWSYDQAEQAPGTSLHEAQADWSHLECLLADD